MKTIKIVHIITRLDKGGSSRVLLDIVGSLDRERFPVTIISGLTKDPYVDLKQLGKDMGIKIVCVNSLRRDVHILFDIIALFKLCMILKKEKPDIVHTHTSKAGFLGRVAAKLSGVPKIIYMPHGHIFYGYASKFMTKLFVILERFAACFTDTIVTLTNIERDEFLKRKIGARDKFITIHNGIDVQGCESVDKVAILALRDKLGIQKDCAVVMTISRLEPIKGLVTFLQALVRVKEARINFKALLVGDGSMRQRLERLAQHLAIKKDVLFLGYRDDIKNIILLSDMVVNAAYNEGLGLAILEAQALGKPVIATRVGGVPEVILDNHTGILVEAENSAALANAIIRLLKDTALAAQLGRQGRQRVAAEFSRDGMIKRFASLYSQTFPTGQVVVSR